MTDCEQLLPDALMYLQSWAKENTVPLNVTFELTPFCNFDCVMCYVRLTKEQAKEQGELLSAEKWLEIAQQAKNMGALNVCLTGGEPFMHPQFWEIYSELNKMGFLITILSNGALIDESLMEKFERYGMPYMMKLTLYGVSDETYKRTCGSPDGFTKICEALDLLRKSNVPCKLTATIVRENACDLQGMYEFAKEKKVPFQHTISVVKSSRGVTKNIKDSRFVFADFPDELSLEDLEKNKFPTVESPFAWCAGHRKTFWMTWNGHMQVCSFMNKPFVKYSGNLAQDWKELNEKTDKIKSPQECDSCEWKAFCQRCPGALCAESGDPEKISEDLCDAAKKLYNLYKTRLNEEEKHEKEICCS